MNKLKSRKFWLTIGSQLIAGYLVSQGHVEAAAIVSSVAAGSYNIGQGQVDAAAAGKTEVVAAAIEAVTAAKKK